MREIDIERYVATSRAAQGLPRYVEDESVAARIVVLLALERADAPGISRTRRAADHLSPAKGDRRGTG